MTIGEKIKATREKAKLTRNALAVRAGLQWNALQQIEDFGRIPTIPILERLARGLGCEVKDLLP